MNDRRKVKINQLDTQPVIQVNILRLDVPVDHTSILLHKVSNI